MSRLRSRLTSWRPRTPPLPPDLANLVKPDDPEWFARELAIAAAPPWWFWRFMLRRFSWLVSLFGGVVETRGLPDQLRLRPLLLAAHPIGDFDPLDRKSTRLNSSHANISDAGFCLKKKV